MDKIFCISTIIVVIFYQLIPVNSLSFTLSSGTTKCLKEELHKDVLVTGEYQLSEASQKTHLTVTDSKGHVLFKKEDATKGKFAFTTEDYEMYKICFQSEGKAGTGMDREVSLVLKHGAEAKDYDKMAAVEKMKPLEIELKRLEDLAEDIVNDFAYMRQREQEMRDTNESTHSRVLYFSVFSMLCLLGLATWQVFYLRRFFIAKKLIE